MEPLSAGSSTVLEPDLSIINKARRRDRMTNPEYFQGRKMVALIMFGLSF